MDRNQTEEQEIELPYLELKLVWPRKEEEDEEIDDDGDMREYMLADTPISILNLWTGLFSES